MVVEVQQVENRENRFFGVVSDFTKTFCKGTIYELTVGSRDNDFCHPL